MLRKATATWCGTGREGSGTLSSDSTVLDNTPYSFPDHPLSAHPPREGAGPGTGAAPLRSERKGRPTADY